MVFGTKVFSRKGSFLARDVDPPLGEIELPGPKSSMATSTAHAPQPRPVFEYARAAYAGKEEDDSEPPEEEEEEEEEATGEFNSDISGGRRWGGKNSLY